MTRVRIGMNMSLDGYAAGPNQSIDSPLGEGGGRVFEWFMGTRYFKELTGQEGGDTGVDDEVVRQWFKGIGANIMGRNMFGPVRGPWPDDSWRGWWGDDPPYHTDVFVLTHHARDPLEMEGGTTFYFVTDGPEAALERARESAGDLDILIAGGASTARQFMQLGLVDEIGVHVAPALLGRGERLFDGMGEVANGYQLAELKSSERVAHYTFRRV
jgi:dihydrofolate reductase